MDIFPSPSTKFWLLCKDDNIKATDDGLNLGLLGGEEGLGWGGEGRGKGCLCKPSTSTAAFISSPGSFPPSPPHQVSGGEAHHLELQPIQIASTPIAIGIVVDNPIAQPAPGPTAGEGK